MLVINQEEENKASRGVPVSVASGIRDRYSVADDGTLAYLSGGGSSPDNSPNGPEKAALFGINRFAKTF